MLTFRGEDAIDQGYGVGRRRSGIPTGTGTQNTFAWNTTGLAAGTWYVGYWVESQGGNPNTYEAVVSLQFNVTMTGLSGYLQHVVDNQKTGVLVDMSPKCALTVVPAQAPAIAKIASVEK